MRSVHGGAQSTLDHAAEQSHAHAQWHTEKNQNDNNNVQYINIILKELI